jgi:hypothetical protein
VFASGRQSSTSSARSSSSYLSMRSKPLIRISSTLLTLGHSLHWYLAIIYQPALVLLPPPPSPSPPPPKETRQRAHRSETSQSSTIAPELPTANSSLPSPSLGLATQETSSEDAVERDLWQFDASCSLGTLGENSSNTPSTSSAAGDAAMDEQDPPMYASSPVPSMDVDNSIEQYLTASRELSPTVSDYGQPTGSNHSLHDVNMIDIPSSPRQEQNDASGLFDDDDMDIQPALHSTAVSPVNFYGKSKKAQGKQKVPSKPLPSIEVGDEEEEVPIFSSADAPLFVVFSNNCLLLLNILQNIYLYDGLSRWKASSCYQEAPEVSPLGSSRQRQSNEDKRSARKTSHCMILNSKL